MKVAVVGVPYRYDEREQGLGRGPGALLRGGLPDALARAGHEVASAAESTLDPDEREPGRTAVNIGKLGARTAGHVAAARAAGARALVLAGDDTACIGVVAGLQAAHDADATIGLVWLDAHGDFNTPETSVSGILAGMPVAILAGLAGPLWREAAGLTAPLPTDRMVIAGVRDLDEREEHLLRSTSAQVITTSQIRARTPLADAVASLAARCDHLCLHVDLDVLDPSLVPSASTPSPNGLDIADAAEAIRVVLGTGKVVAFGVAGLNPGAGARGERSLRSAQALLDAVLPGWA